MKRPMQATDTPEEELSGVFAKIEKVDISEVFAAMVQITDKAVADPALRAQLRALAKKGQDEVAVQRILLLKAVL